MGQVLSYLFGDDPADRQPTYQPRPVAAQDEYRRPDYVSYPSRNRPLSTTNHSDQSYASIIRSSNSVYLQAAQDEYRRPDYVSYPSRNRPLSTTNHSDQSYASIIRSPNSVYLQDTKVQVEVKRDSCRTATVRWSSTRDSQVDITITIVTGNSRTDTPLRYRRLAIERAFRVPTQLVRGKEYNVVVRGVTSGAQGTTTFRAVFTSSELHTLHDMAVRHVRRGGGNKFQRCDVFYRNKLFSYFTECQRNNNVMAVYMKDNNGDPASIINGQIKGLFFATSVDPQTGRPPDWSFFGPKRVSIPATTMLTYQNSNLYFADFYCNDKAHYVTIVLTRPGSETDRFCEKNLIKLDTGRNDFLWRNNQVYFSKKVWVEVLYTEDVQLSSPLCSFSMVEGRGTSRPGGLPKNPSCAKCNLPYPPTTATHPTGYGVNLDRFLTDW